MSPTNLLEPISELIGRDDVLGEILSLASAHRLVTLTGAGGIGKTRLALPAPCQRIATPVVTFDTRHHVTKRRLGTQRDR